MVALAGDGYPAPEVGKERLKCQTMSVALDTLKALSPSDIHRGLKAWSQKELK